MRSARLFVKPTPRSRAIVPLSAQRLHFLPSKRVRHYPSYSSSSVILVTKSVSLDEAYIEKESDTLTIGGASFERVRTKGIEQSVHALSRASL